MTPREVLAAARLSQYSSEYQSDHLTARDFDSDADDLLAALSAAGFEVLPTALVDAVVDAIDGNGDWGDCRDASSNLRAYRAPVLLGQTEETQP